MAKLNTADPASMIAEIKSHPPLMQDDAKKKYIGKEVEWLLTFSSGSMHQDEAHLLFRSEQRALERAADLGGVSGKVSFASETLHFSAGMKRSPEAREKPRPLGRGDSLSAYPWLKSLRAEEPVRVRGRIRGVHFIVIELDILELSVPEPATS